MTAAFIMPFNAAAPHEIAFAVHHFRAADGAKPPDLLPDADAPLGIIIQGGSDVALRMTVSASQHSAYPSAMPPPHRRNRRTIAM